MRQTEREIGTIRKSWRNRLKVALIYPNSYHVGMSNLGFQTVYQQFNLIEHVVCERGFLPHARDPAAAIIRSIESQKPLTAFDLIAFSISFENDYPHILTILNCAGLPLRADQRTASHPLVIAGGVACSLNPEPLAPFIDSFLIGESETFLARFCELFDARADRAANLKALTHQIAGLYVPQFYKPQYRPDGTLRSFEPQGDVPAQVRRPYVKDLALISTCSAILTPDTTFEHTFLIEASRGCPYGCRFCCAGYIYRPPRYRPPAKILDSIRKGAALSPKIGLISAAVADLPGINDLCRQILSSSKREVAESPELDPDLRISFSSLRADAITPELIALLKHSRVKTVALAPDAGSARLRRVINKDLSEAAILDTAEQLVLNGIFNIRLYFMIGLPTETLADVEAVVSLCKKIKHVFLKTSRTRKRIGTITVNLNSFVPKPFTPFQWTAMDEVPRLKQKIKHIRTGLKKTANVRVHADIPRWAFMQGLFSRGDRKMADILALAHQNQWNWPQTLKASPINPDFYVLRRRALDELFPWDFIDHGIDKAFLRQEYQKALEEKPSPPCPVKNCTICGVCR